MSDIKKITFVFRADLEQWVEDGELQIGHIEKFVKDYEKLDTLLQEAVSKSRKIDDIYEALARVRGVNMISILDSIKEFGEWDIAYDSITTDIDVDKLQLDEWFCGNVFNEEKDENENFDFINIHTARKFLEDNKG
jgi:16S rRNA G527 N7-methylase RsmG